MMGSVPWLVATALLGLTLPLHAFGLYAVLLLLAGSVRRERSVPGRTDKPSPIRIAVLVVAHDEEQVVRISVKSLVAQRYPAESFAVYVVADHCADRTAAVAAEAGARVLERNAGGATGKSAAVAFGVETVARAGGYDAIAVFDADNEVDPDFLSRVSARLEGGERVVQGFVDSQNAGASWVSASSALGFWAIAEINQAPRERLALSTPLMGTGFVMDVEAASRWLTTGGALADDLDLAARLTLAGVRVAYEPTARTVDEKPTRLGTAVAQRHRWMQGRWAVAGMHAPGLVRAAFARRAPALERWRALDVAVQLVSPSLLFAAVATALLGALSWGAAAAADGGSGTGRLALGSLCFSALYYVVPAVRIARHRPELRVWLCYLLQPGYLVLSLPLAISGFLTRRGGRWIRTPKGV